MNTAVKLLFKIKTIKAMKTHVLKITTTSQKLRYPPPFFLNGAGEGREGGKNRRKQI